jgi:hypothetical protein
MMKYTNSPSSHNNNSNRRSFNSNESSYFYPPERLVKNIEHGKTVKFLKNGDETFSGHQVVINSRKYRSFDYFLDDLSKTLNARFGAVRNIHTPVYGHKVRNLEEIEDGKTYVATGYMQFKKLK